MTKTLFISALFLIILASSCSREDDNSNDGNLSYLKGPGVFLLNEGNFMSGNGSLSFYSFDSSAIYNDLFTTVNSRPLGDIPNSMTMDGNILYIVVNNSGKIEVADAVTMKSLKTIRGLDSPRQLIIVSDRKAYVSSLFSDRIAIIDLLSYSVTGYIDIRRSSEAMVMLHNKVYVSCWSSGNEIMIIDPVSDMVKDSITVGYEPESMIADRNNNLWVICSGGYSGLYYPQLVFVNTLTDKTEKVFQFPAKNLSPSSLCVNGTGDTIYYIDRGIRRMCITDAALPSSHFVPASGRLFYKLAYNNRDGGLFATNAMDYQQKGYLIRITMKGLVTDSARAGIIPAAICFNENVN